MPVYQANFGGAFLNQALTHSPRATTSANHHNRALVGTPVGLEFFDVANEACCIVVAAYQAAILFDGDTTDGAHFVQWDQSRRQFSALAVCVEW
jgi:hypothetical protein